MLSLKGKQVVQRLGHKLSAPATVVEVGVMLEDGDPFFCLLVVKEDGSLEDWSAQTCELKQESES